MKSQRVPLERRPLRLTVRLAPRLFGLAMLAAVSGATAQSIDGLDLGAIRARNSASTDELEALVASALKRAEAQSGAAEQVRADTHQTSAHEQQALSARAPAGVVDFDAILDGAAANAKVPMGEGPLLIVFASLSMPQASLQHLVRDTTRAGGVVVFRGFPDNSVKAFARGLMRVVTSRQEEAHIAIDPRLFRAFRIDAAPTFVVAEGGYELCDGLDCTNAVPAHARMTGNVSLAYALEHFAAANESGAAIARTALNQLEKGRGQ
ncbi:type-F conjugative transfer system pilin assembly protein TrbC (plasmid) [Novosphingobium sp. THN1]|nr:type-F conjugative transfer system pilin assembly protein TrbC [Novosphingobium sp. THN1]